MLRQSKIDETPVPPQEEGIRPTKLGGEETQAVSLEELNAVGHAGSGADDQPAAAAPSVTQSPILSGAAAGE